MADSLVVLLHRLLGRRQDSEVGARWLLLCAAGKLIGHSDLSNYAVLHLKHPVSVCIAQRTQAPPPVLDVKAVVKSKCDRAWTVVCQISKAAVHASFASF